MSKSPWERFVIGPLYTTKARILSEDFLSKPELYDFLDIGLKGHRVMKTALVHCTFLVSSSSNPYIFSSSPFVCKRLLKTFEDEHMHIYIYASDQNVISRN